MRDREKKAAASIEKAFKCLMEVQRREKEEEFYNYDEGGV